MRDFNRLDGSLFNNPPTSQEIIQELNDKVPNDDSYHRVRLLVSTTNDITVEHTILPVPEYSIESLDEAAGMSPTLSVVLDTEPLSQSSDDPYIVHKTTKREVYDNSRARTNCQWHGNNNEPFDVILYNANNEITETSITNIAIRFKTHDGYVWKTPKINCGLLPGVFRTYLLESQQNMVEDMITVEDLRMAQKVLLKYKNDSFFKKKK
ncbi:aminotransferase [Pilaira anomala]|nr:aminotransferase [Pilaira anomala]